MAVYAIEKTELKINGKLATLQPGSSQLFNKNEDFIIKCEVKQSFMNSPSFIVFLYYLEGDVDVAYNTTTIALFHVEIKTFSFKIFIQTNKGEGWWILFV